MFKKVFFALLVALFCVVGITAQAQNYLPFTAAGCITDATGGTLASGTMTIQATDAANNPIPFRAGGNFQSTTAPITKTITSGVVTTFNIANPAFTSPQWIRYRISILDNLTKRVTAYNQVAVTDNDGTGTPTFNFCKFDTGVTLPVLQVTGPVGPIGPPGITVSTAADIAFAGNDSFPAITETRARIVRTGLLAEYNFSDGTGTTLSDVSGNGYTGTLSGASWITGGGLSCNATSGNFVTLNAGLSAAKSVMVFQKYGPFNSGGEPPSLVPAVIASTNANGIFLKESFKVTDASGSATRMAGQPAIMQNGATAVGTFETSVGWHMITANLSTPNGTIYVDDGAVASYYVNTGVTTPSLGQYQFCGSSAMASSFWGGSLYYAAFYDHSLSASEVAQNYRAVVDYERVHGVNMAPLRNSWGKASRLMATGDSITENNYLQYMGTLDDPAGNGWALTNDGVSGSWTYDVLAQIPLREATQVVQNGQRCVDILFAGTNNINGGMSVNDTASALFATARTMKQTLGPNCKVIMGTMLNRTGFDTQEIQLNSIIRVRWPEVADSLVDFASDPNLGCTGCSTNATYFQQTGEPGVHPTLPTGETLLANYATNAVNALYGPKDPSVATTITAATYTETASDTFLNANASTNSVAITLPSATGYTTTSRCVRNNTVAVTANTVTLATPAGQGFDNAGSTTTVLIPQGSTLCVTAALASSSSPASYWQRIAGVPTTFSGGPAFTPVCTNGCSQLGSSTNPWSGVQIGTSGTLRSNITTTATAARAVSLPDAGGTLMIAPAATTTGRAACIKGTGQIGYCSTQPDATGACTCN